MEAGSCILHQGWLPETRSQSVALPPLQGSQACDNTAIFRLNCGVTSLPTHEKIKHSLLKIALKNHRKPYGMTELEGPWPKPAISQQC